MTIHEAVWIRIAGSAANIKEGKPHHWRCFIDRQGPAVPLITWRLEGAVSGANHIVGTAPKNDEPNGLTAWIDVFGTIRIEDDVAVVQLLTPAR